LWTLSKVAQMVPNVSTYVFYFLFFVNLLFCAAEPIIICTECRFSDPALTTPLDKATVKQKRELTVKQFRPYFNEGTILPFGKPDPISH
jgi:hypothetical protein